MESSASSAGPTTTVTSYTTQPDEIGGSGGVAYARGHGELAFTLVDSTGNASQHVSRSTFLMVAKRQTDGSWKIAQRMWAALSD